MRATAFLFFSSRNSPPDGSILSQRGGFALAQDDGMRISQPTACTHLALNARALPPRPSLPDRFFPRRCALFFRRVPAELFFDCALQLFIRRVIRRYQNSTNAASFVLLFRWLKQRIVDVMSFSFRLSGN